MTKLYIILSIVGWAWLIVAAVVLPIRLRRVSQDQSAPSTGFPIEPTIPSSELHDFDRT